MAATTKIWVNNSPPSADDSDLNGFKLENNNLITSSGQSLNVGDRQQTSKGVANYVANSTFYTDSGAADTYVLTAIGSKQSITAYTDGSTFEFVAGNPNTGGASTVNVSALGVKNIKLSDGTDPAVGQIDGRTLLKFDSGNDRAELILTGSVTTTIFTVSGTYNPPASVKSLEFTAIGAGGGGGGVDGQGAGTVALSIAGAGGGSSKKITNSIESSYTITIGAGGSGGAAGTNNGSSGGSTTVVSTGVNLTCTGGAGGDGRLGNSGNSTPAGALGGVGSGGDVNITGSGSSISASVSGAVGTASISGDSILGGSIRSGTGAATIATVPGTGGSGSGAVAVLTNFAGGDGANGIIIIREFF